MRKWEGRGRWSTPRKRNSGRRKVRGEEEGGLGAVGPNEGTWGWGIKGPEGPVVDWRPRVERLAGCGVDRHLRAALLVA